MKPQTDTKELARAVWSRYAWCRDNGHSSFMQHAEKCARFYSGEQWDAKDLQSLAETRRPALTVNIVLSIINTALGELINNRSEAACRPASGADPQLADVMTKVLKQIGENNNLPWLRTDVCRDGLLTGRGFYDVRLDYNDSMQGEVRITALNPKNVIVDPDAEEYDPDTWSEVFVTKWLTVDDIAVLYGNDKAEQLRGREGSRYVFGYDSMDALRDRFGERFNTWYGTPEAEHANVTRGVRVIERQWRELHQQQHFVNPQTGDTRPVPDDMPKERIQEIVQTQGVLLAKRPVRRIRWAVVADDVVLHDSFSPYEHFTVVPFFPYYMRGKPFGMMHNLMDTQELVNKTMSQELHVINTTANSGWKVKAGSLANMTPAEFEARGAQTGLVIEVADDVDNVQKILPNNIPQGLSTLSQKAGDYLRIISGVTDSMMGLDRADVAAKAIQTKRSASALALAPVEDNANRTEHMVARAVLSLVQNFYTEPRVMTITHNQATGDTETFEVNQPTAEGQILNDLTADEYSLHIVSVPYRETLEDSQFDQLMAMREAGCAIPDDLLIEVSRLQNKGDILQRLRGDNESPEAQMEQQLQQRAAQAEVAKAEAEAQQKGADAQLRLAKAQAALQPKDNSDQRALEREKTYIAAQHEEQRLEMERQVNAAKLALEQEKMQRDDTQKRADAEVAAAQATARQMLGDDNPKEKP